MRAKLFLIPLLLSSAACQGSVDAREQAPAATPAPAAAAAAAATSRADPPVAAGEARTVRQETGSYVFDYSYPAQAARHPVLAAYLEKELATSRAALAREADQFLRNRDPQDTRAVKYSLGTGWSVVTDLPGWLSLSAQISSYSGGAHGNHGMATLLYDKSDGEIRQPLDLFKGRAALWQAIETRFCAALDKQREERRGEPVDKGDDLFGVCPGLDELVLLLGSSNRQSFDRMTLYAGPYVAGPYAEGDYEVDLDIDAAVLAAVRPEYAEAFSARRR